MKYPVICIRDRKTNFMTPTIDLNEAAAIRNFSHAVQQAGTIMNTHPSDFDLFVVGEFDNESGILRGVDHKFLANGGDMFEYE